MPDSCEVPLNNSAITHTRTLSALRIIITWNINSDVKHSRVSRGLGETDVPGHSPHVPRCFSTTPRLLRGRALKRNLKDDRLFKAELLMFFFPHMV